MGIWNFYFIAKLFLYFGNYIGFHVLPNLLFAASLAFPIPNKRLRLLRQVIAVPVGISLLYYDTWLPPISRVIEQSAQLQGFSLPYMMELVGRFISVPVLAMLALLYAGYFFAEKKLRISAFVFIAMLLLMIPVAEKFPAVNNVFVDNTVEEMPSVTDVEDETFVVEDFTLNNTVASMEQEQKVSGLAPPVASMTDHVYGMPDDSELNEVLTSFYRREAVQRVSFLPPDSSDAPFDIIFLQICSLSWDDLRYTKEQDNLLFKRFDIVFTNFNSAASYSGPAVIRLLRGSCGQKNHLGLYAPVTQQCQTFNGLEEIGFESRLAMNHDGQYGQFLADIRNRGGLNAKLFDTTGTPAYLQSFDGSPIYGDYAVLAKWWKSRLKSPSGRVALFYNSISLHDGNRYAENKYANSLEIYQPRQARLLGDIDRFMADLQTSGRRAVVVFVPEHGASIRGDKMQIAGLREIPSPRISIVPVGIKLIGMVEKPDENPLVVSRPSSYLAISQLLANFISNTPFDHDSPGMKDYVQNLPSTPFVSENEDVIVMRHNKRYFIHSRDAEWVEYDPG